MRPFAIGDIVRHKKTGERHIIHEAQMLDEEDPDHIEYSTNLGAWFNHTEFTLISRSTAYSRRELLTAIYEELE